jgi:hypothetical protein
VEAAAIAVALIKVFRMEVMVVQVVVNLQTEVLMELVFQDKVTEVDNTETDLLVDMVLEAAVAAKAQ